MLADAHKHVISDVMALVEIRRLCVKEVATVAMTARRENIAFAVRCDSCRT